MSSNLRILQMHNRYQQAGGEDMVVEAERSVLRARGQVVELLEKDNHTISGIKQRLVTAVDAPYSNTSRQEVKRALLQYSPDVVHVHNFFPLLTPSVYDACREAGVPVVQTLHNYRLICPGALLMRGGRVCEDCVNGSAYQSVL